MNKKIDLDSSMMIKILVTEEIIFEIIYYTSYL